MRKKNVEKKDVCAIELAAVSNLVHLIFIPLGFFFFSGRNIGQKNNAWSQAFSTSQNEPVHTHVNTH